MDGVLVDSEQVWDQARRDVVDAHGGTWKDSATRDMLGMSSKEWSVYVVDELGAQLTPEQVNDAVVEAMLAGYRARTCRCCPGAREAIERLGERHTLGLASSSNRPVIDLVLETMGVTDRFAATVSSEEVARGKPAPDVYLEAMRRGGLTGGVAIEDSENGIKSAHAAGLRVIAIPNPHFPPPDDALALADEILPDLDAVRSGTELRRSRRTAVPAGPCPRTSVAGLFEAGEAEGRALPLDPADERERLAAALLAVDTSAERDRRRSRRASKRSAADRFAATSDIARQIEADTGPPHWTLGKR